MKTSWLNGSKRILSALLIAAALMFGWTPLGEGNALAATEKGKQFAQAAMLFAKSDTDFAQDMYGAKGTDNNQIFEGGAWCAAFSKRAKTGRGMGSGRNCERTSRRS